MIGSFNNDRNNYRCTYAAEYTDANRIAHPRSIYVREDHILEQLDPWLARALSPGRLTATVQTMADSQHDQIDQQAIQAAATPWPDGPRGWTATAPPLTAEPAPPASTAGSQKYRPNR